MEWSCILLSTDVGFSDLSHFNILVHDNESTTVEQEIFMTGKFRESTAAGGSRISELYSFSALK